MLDANVATTILPSVLLKISSNASVTSRSDPVKPRRSMFVLSAKSASTPVVPSSAKPPEVDVLAVERRLIDLEVARVDDRPCRRVDDDRDAVRHAVRDAQELEPERADRHRLARANRPQPIARLDAVLLELRLDEREGERRPVHGAVDVGQDVGDRADMVLVAVREHERLKAALVLLQQPQIRNDQVDAEQFRLRKQARRHR